jgi:hypothetical protein
MCNKPSGQSVIWILCCICVTLRLLNSFYQDFYVGISNLYRPLTRAFNSESKFVVFQRLMEEVQEYDLGKR